MAWPDPKKSVQDLLQEMKGVYDQLEQNKTVRLIREVELVHISAKKTYSDILWVGRLYEDGTVTQHTVNVNAQEEIGNIEMKNAGDAYLEHLIIKKKIEGYVENSL